MTTLARRVSVKNRPGIYYREGQHGRRYEIAFRDSDGRQRWKVTGGNLKEAEGALEAMRGRMRRGERVAPTRVTFEEGVALWRPTLASLDSDPGRVQSSLRVHLLPAFGPLRLAEISTDDVARFIDNLKGQGYASWSDSRSANCPRAGLQLAVRRGIVGANPVKGLERGERPTVSVGEMRILDRDEIGKLLAAANPDRRALLATGVFTGLRLGELLGLIWSDIDLDRGTIWVSRQLDRKSGERVEPKTLKAKRSVVLMPALGRILREHRLRSRHSGDDDFVFAASDGGGFGSDRRPLGADPGCEGRWARRARQAQASLPRTPPQLRLSARAPGWERCLCLPRARPREP